jgi:carboxyl-terminal processing protease
MDGLRNLLKLALAVTLIVLLVGAAFVFGYRAGSTTEDEAATNSSPENNPGEQIVSSHAQPTATAEPTASAAPTDVAVPSLTPHHEPETETETPTPIDTLPAPTWTAEATIVLETPEPTPTPAEPTSESTLSDDEALGVLQEVWSLVEDEFFGELPSSDERAYGAIRGMLGTLGDDYTSFSEPSIADIRRTDASGSFEGIGAMVSMTEEGILQIAQPFKDSPAEKAGLLSGDLVLAVDGVSIEGYGIYEAITLIRGPEGTEVVLTIKRADEEPFEARIVRARLEIPTVESEMLDGNIGYVSLFEFSTPATSRLQVAIEELFDQGATALIFDLRGNPGGFLDQAVKVSDLFLDEGLVLIERRSDGQEIEFTSNGDGLAQDIPLVVLVNGGSASASEIVAGAIQDRGRAVLIGETTFGKGSVQLLHMLSDGSELRVTVARWFTPNDHAIHGEGLAPDIEMLLTPEDAESDRDPQLERAIEYLKTGE